MRRLLIAVTFALPFMAGGFVLPFAANGADTPVLSRAGQVAMPNTVTGRDGNTTSRDNAMTARMPSIGGGIGGNFAGGAGVNMVQPIPKTGCAAGKCPEDCTGPDCPGGGMADCTKPENCDKLECKGWGICKPVDCTKPENKDKPECKIDCSKPEHQNKPECKIDCNDKKNCDKPQCKDHPNCVVIDCDDPKNCDKKECKESDACKPECKDGGVKNSTYTVDNCMNDILTCVRGALPNGLNDLFNSDLRNAIQNGMNLCAAQVDKCQTTVRQNCENVYLGRTDVWLDFNSRVIQPNYYAFILRKTGLTPNQAETVCMLLDKNVYGASFNAVSIYDDVTTEYNKTVRAYNNQSDTFKDNPVGVTVNDGNPGVDGVRGHYARWDATTGECLIRVAAYHKDNLVTNKWVFGGDDQPAEAWKPAGSNFTCNRDLFGFNMLNNTKNVAAIGIPAATALGAGVGAIIGHNTGEETDCFDWSAQTGTFDKDPTNFDVIRKLPGCEGITTRNDLAAIPADGQCSKSIGQGCQDANGGNFAGLICTKTGTCIDRHTGQGALIGAASGLGAGGLATLITSFVEKNEIDCRVGDGLDKVGYGKTGRVETLKDYYVKWALNLPDTIRPTANVTDCGTWRNVCGGITELFQCTSAQINFKPRGAQTPILVDNACATSGSVCIENFPIAVSQGACKQSQRPGGGKFTISGKFKKDGDTSGDRTGGKYGMETDTPYGATDKDGKVTLPGGWVQQNQW